MRYADLDRSFGVLDSTLIPDWAGTANDTLDQLNAIGLEPLGVLHPAGCDVLLALLASATRCKYVDALPVLRSRSSLCLVCGLDFSIPCSDSSMLLAPRCRWQGCAEHAAV